MPELPEVEIIKQGLGKLLPGLIIKGVNYDWAKSFPNAPADVKHFLIGAKTVDIVRRGKALIIDLSSKYSLVIHLKMTGQLVYVQRVKSREQIADKRFGAGHPNNSLIGRLPDKSTRVTLDFSNGAKLFFNDQRKFGWMKLIPSSEVPNIDFMRKLGPEPLAVDFTAKEFGNRLKRRQNTSVKAVLLDQTVIAGVGNIYADEALWGAKVHPSTVVKDLSEQKVNLLFKELQYVLNLSIEKSGSTDRNYVNHEGKKGSYLSVARVFRREGQPCPRCGATIIKIRVADRGTHICPNCQKYRGRK